jgi:hypothetical protein
LPQPCTRGPGPIKPGGSRRRGRESRTPHDRPRGPSGPKLNVPAAFGAGIQWMPSSSSPGGTSIVSANLTSVSIRGTRSPLSHTPIAVRCNPARLASSSWLRPRLGSRWTGFPGCPPAQSLFHPYCHSRSLIPLCLRREIGRDRRIVVKGKVGSTVRHCMHSADTRQGNCECLRADTDRELNHGVAGTNSCPKKGSVIVGGALVSV